MSNFHGIHPKKLTWNLEMMVSNRNLLFQGSIFRFHVCFWGCISQIFQHYQPPRKFFSQRVYASGSKTVPMKYLFLGFIMFIVVFRPGGHVHPHCLATYFTHARTLKAFVCKVLRNGLLRYILYTCSQPNVTRVQSATEWTASVHTLHMLAT